MSNRWRYDSTEAVCKGLDMLAEWLAYQDGRSEKDIQVELLREAANRLVHQGGHIRFLRVELDQNEDRAEKLAQTLRSIPRSTIRQHAESHGLDVDEVLEARDFYTEDGDG